MPGPPNRFFKSSSKLKDCRNRRTQADDAELARYQVLAVLAAARLASGRETILDEERHRWCCNGIEQACASLVRYIEQCSGLSPSRALEQFYGLLANAVRAE